MSMDALTYSLMYHQQHQNMQQPMNMLAAAAEGVSGRPGGRPDARQEGGRKPNSETDGDDLSDEGVSGSAPNGSWKAAPTSWVGKRPRAVETSSSKAAALKACKEKARRGKINTR